MLSSLALWLEGVTGAGGGLLGWRRCAGADSACLSSHASLALWRSCSSACARTCVCVLG